MVIWTARERSDRGFTLVELLVVMTLFGVLVALGVMPLRNYQRAQEHTGGSREVVAALRNAQVRAVSEGTPYKVVFQTSKVLVYRGVAGATGYTYGPAATREIPISPSLQLTDASFTATSGAGSDAYFYARGTAASGSVVVRRTGSSKTYTIDIEGLTARVSLR